MRRPQNSFWTFPNPENTPLRSQKVKNDTKIKSKSNVRFERNIENERCLSTWVETKTVVEPYPNPKNSPLAPQKPKNYPKIDKKKSNIKIEENIQNESLSTT